MVHEGRAVTLMAILLAVLLVGPAMAAGQEITIALSGEPSTLDPQRAPDRLASIISSNIFDSLTARDAQLKIRPALAKSFKRLDDRTWQFELRDGVKFHNGEPFDAQAVKFSIERFLDPATKAPHISYVNTIERVEVVGPMTVKLVTKAPDPLLLYRIAELHGQIVPPKYVQEKGPVEFARAPVGTGPYKVERFTRNDRLVLVANEAYWRGAPKIKRITIRPVKEDATRMAMVLSGEADLVNNVPAVQVARLQSSGRVAVKTATTPRVFHVVIDTTRAPFTDKRVRQALNHAVDVPTIINKVYMGHGQRVATTVGTKSFGYDPKIPPYPYDPERARKLLAEAGHPNGFAVTFDAFTGSIVDHTAVAEAVVGYLEKVGIKATMNVTESGVFEPTRLANKTNPLFIYSFGDIWLDAALPLNYAMQGRLGHYYQNAALKAKLDEANQTLDEGKRRAMYSEIQQIFREEAVKIFLFQYEAIYATSARVRFAPPEDEVLRFFELAPGE